MSAIKLSICLPTFNRAVFLNKALAYFVTDYKIPFEYEIVISDNASTDNTREIVDAYISEGLPIRYFRRTENLGYEPNLSSAFRHARGEYNVYLADDDMLIIDGIVDTIKYLDANPDVTACYAPWYLHDEVQKVDQTLFYTVKADRKYERRDFLGVFAFLVESHVFPEIGIYRASALRSAWVPRYFSYWAFSHLAHYLDLGAVTFRQKPFYRAVTVSTIPRDRPQAGNDELLTAWDRYRGGLEYFVNLGVKRGVLRFDQQFIAQYESLIKHFTLNRMAVALRFWFARKEYLRSYELYSRLCFGGFGDHPDVTGVQGQLPLMAAVQTLAWATNSAAEVNRLVLHGMADPASIEGLLRELGLRADIEVVYGGNEPSPSEPERAAVFVPNAADRIIYLQKGHPQNLVFSEEDLIQPLAI
ncbi:glycosyltransferase family 2 protein [Rhizobium laguerreae]|uniref:glycosyltransferase family 2 protein n=1 Tax=Rhizobium laguerreae TaxID=1076926 RepID=UPI001C926ED2|nr:glycosyltransferase family 2 protein [Rhizobium laguerreae]MBY3072600.1 glycosyltransferase family 2 protein [Rhizobium laguerreae]MBY3090821.1 glycosyltransferase family 2 protein [Rhizobium laguerreae]